MCIPALRPGNGAEFAIHEKEEKVSSISSKPDPAKILPNAYCEVWDTSKIEGFFADSFLFSA